MGPVVLDIMARIILLQSVVLWNYPSQSRANGWFVRLCAYRDYAFNTYSNSVQVHAYIIAALKKEMPSMFGKDSKKKELIKNLSAIYEGVQREHQISPGDFPDIARMQVIRRGLVFSAWYGGEGTRPLPGIRWHLTLSLGAGLSEAGVLNDMVPQYTSCEVLFYNSLTNMA